MPADEIKTNYWKKVLSVKKVTDQKLFEVSKMISF